jgi:hypothetical protein
MTDQFATVDELRDALDGLKARCDAARGAGGVSMIEHFRDGTPIPDGWVLDEIVSYFIPPNVTLFPLGRRQ